MDYLWTGRLKGTLHHLAKRLTFSIDSNLILFDISGSIVHAEMLVRQKIITRREGQQIISGLKKIQAEVQKGIFIFKQEDEDIHTAVERRLVEIIGETGGKLHTARSRNDQIVLDEKLYLKQMLPEIMDKIRLLQKTLLNNAEKNFGFCMPEMTHFQPAQPVLFSHHLMA
ncbi:MAG TPA: lyase family protein, partial [bacterium]|nr:lyase family protein [bacterium]